MIEINQLQYRYKGAPAPSLRDISLKIPQQSLFGLLGPNGAGKTTLLSILSGIFSLENTLTTFTNTIYRSN